MDTIHTFNSPLSFQCSEGTGVCKDSDQGGSDDVEDTAGFTVDGVTTITFRRKINTGDSKDKMYSGEKQIVWAMGPVDVAKMLPNKHHTRITCKSNQPLLVTCSSGMAPKCSFNLSPQWPGG